MHRWILLLFLPVVLYGQNTTGTITGFVRDPSSALLPAAHVTVVNENTGLRRDLLTNSEGLYTIPFLPVGVYSVTAGKEGFKSQVQKGIRVEILQVRSVDFVLELGATSETVTVESRAPLLETETSQAGQVIKGEQVNNLPLNVRQFMQLAFLAPMVTPATNDYRSVEVNRDITAPAAAGQRPEQNNYQIDGVDNRESGRNNVAVGVPVDSVGEFRVQTGISPAEFGRGGGLIINVATKTGTNRLHGSLYEFLRNNQFDSRPFFSSRVSPLKRNQFGGALGGPILRDKLFFFGNYEGFREASTGNPPVGVVLTDPQRQGIMNGPVKDPMNGGAPFPNNTIPASRINPISQQILGLLPLPNNPDPLRNFIFNGIPSGHTRRDYAVGRVDYNIGPKDILYGRYLFNNENQTTPPGLPPPANSGGRDFLLRAQSASAHWNRVLSPSLINNLTLGFTRYRNILQTLNSFHQDFITPFGITNTLSAVDPLFWAAPSVTVPGYLMPSEVTPNFRTMNNFQLQESGLWNHGKHTIKFGADARQIRTYMFYTGGNGSTAFNNRYTGDPAADFLLGYASNVNKTARATNWNSRIGYVAAYLQDDWKLTPRFTLNLGLRYEVESALKQIDNGGPGFDIATGAVLVSKYATNLQAIQDFYRTIRTDIPLRVEENRRAPYNADTNNIAPRVGFAYNFAKNMVLRGGYGLFYDAPQIQALASANDFAPNTLRPIWTADPNIPNLGYNPEGTTSAEQTLRNAPLTLFPFLSRNFPYGKIQQWSLSLQRQLSSSLVLELLYQGSNSVNLLLLDNVDVKSPGPGNVQQLLPYPGFARVAAYNTWGQANYNGLGVKLEQRFSRNLSYLVSYTYSKSIDTGSSFDVNPAWVDPFNKLASARGPSDFDARNRFSAAYQYRLPVGKGQRFGSSLSGIADKLAGGWGVRGVTTFQTGLPQSPSMSIARNGTCVATCIARPDRIGGGNLDKSTRTLQRFYDVSAFRLLAQGGVEARVGNAGRNILNSAGINNWDLQVFKDTAIREGQSLEFRWEMFNAFNHTQWGPAGTNLEAPQQFGVISSTGLPRIMQFVLRYAF
ncbi:MAG TPA: TonB-dependent receptor [Bryobacteraceae bacterium]|nr:TonB-dependent receptor [Bryobacteraceae bacterium]